MKYLIIFSVLTNISFSQNIIYNGGFEIYRIPKVEFPIFSDIHYSKGWSNPNFASPDSYHLIKNPNKKIIFENGQTLPNTGECFSGIGFFKYENFEYIQTKLNRPLIKGKQYCLSIFFFLAPKINYSVNEIGFVISEEKIRARKKQIINVAKYNLFKSENLLRRSNKWIELKSIYNSNGNEKYLTIGNFNQNIKYNFIGNVKNKKEVDSKYTYYFIDDVSLLEIQDSSECNCKEILPKKDSIKVDTVKSVSQYDEALTSSIILKDINFETDKSDLLQSSYKELDKLVKYLMQNPSFKIEITGYTDNTGNEEDNIKLSEQRAKAVAGYLIKEGIDTKRITYKGFGSKKPLLPNDTEEHKRVNRRVEFKLIAN